MRRSQWNYTAVAGTEEERVSMTAVMKQLLDIDFIADIQRKKKVSRAPECACVPIRNLLAW